MPTITFASSKGGCGKSTAAVLLAAALAERSALTIIDADPNQPVVLWSKRPGRPKNLTVVGGVTQDTLIARVSAKPGCTSAPARTGIPWHGGHGQGWRAQSGADHLGAASGEDAEIIASVGQGRGLGSAAAMLALCLISPRGRPSAR